MLSPSLEELAKRQAQLRAALIQITDMRPGSLVERFRVCGKPTCHCAQKGSPGHGPSWSLTRAVAGKTITKVIQPHAVETTRAQIAEYRRFRAITKELVEVSDQLCDARLLQGEAASEETAKKGASKRSSKSRSDRRSTPS